MASEVKMFTQYKQLQPGDYNLKTNKQTTKSVLQATELQKKSSQK